MVKHRLGEMPPIGVAAWVVTAATVLLIPAAAIGFPDAAPGLGPVAAVTRSASSAPGSRSRSSTT